MTTLTFYGGARSVTGSNYLIETEKTKIVIDCGLIQGGKHAEDQNTLPFAYDPKQVTVVLITHAHIDHTGRLPKLFKDGFRGEVISTNPTKDLIKIMLEDSQDLLEAEARRENSIPLYSKEDVQDVVEHCRGVDYNEEFLINNDIRVRFRDAGHILGSAIIEVWVKNEKGEEKKIAFSGDLGNPSAVLIRPTENIEGVDYAIIESAYGNRRHEEAGERKNMLEDTIEDTITKGGVLMIPSFAVERTQELLYELNLLIENHRIPSVPIFIDSPMAIDALKIYAKYPQYYNQEAMHLIAKGDKLFDFPRLQFTYTSDESKKINEVLAPKIIIAGSGMSTGGRILHHEIRYLSDPNSTLLIIGYQVAGSLGRRLLDGADEVKILGQDVTVRARIKAIGGYSAHADQDGLYSWINEMNKMGHLNKVFVVQGEEAAALALSQLLRDNLGVDAVAPTAGESFVI
ncbi:MAG: MBL fold metallo-hydrolase [Candidatus Spechtbacteria bacterium]|nr:MBL fold metallo-hydrolase [Candidatus Spechtbacteria bacterium]